MTVNKPTFRVRAAEIREFALQGKAMSDCLALIRDAVEAVDVDAYESARTYLSGAFERIRPIAEGIVELREMLDEEHVCRKCCRCRYEWAETPVDCKTEHSCA